MDIVVPSLSNPAPSETITSPSFKDFYGVGYCFPVYYFIGKDAILYFIGGSLGNNDTLGSVIRNDNICLTSAHQALVLVPEYGPHAYCACCLIYNTADDVHFSFLLITGTVIQFERNFGKGL